MKKPTVGSLVRKSSLVAALGSALTAENSAYGQGSYAMSVRPVSGFQIQHQISAFRQSESFSPLVVDDTSKAFRGSSYAPENSVPEYQLDEDVVSALGATSHSRIKDFQQLPDGWRFGVGKVLSLPSIAAMELFVKEYHQLLNSHFGTPRVFLSDNGEIELLWRASDDQEVFLRFGEDEIEYLISPGDIDGRGDADDVMDRVVEALEPTVVA